MSSSNPADRTFSKYPEFEKREKDLINAARSTCFIACRALDPHTGRLLQCAGTAFFISENTLYTAAHNVENNDGPIIGLEPGTPEAPSPKMILEGERQNGTFHCKVRTIYRKWDVAILTTEYRSQCHIHCGQIDQQNDENCFVDVLGYPGPLDTDGFISKYGCDFNNMQKQLENARKLLPMRKLVVSYGKVLAGETPRIYAISTHSGMSGGPVISNGTAIGTVPFILLHCPVGIHIGGSLDRKNEWTAISDFEGDPDRQTSTTKRVAKPNLRITITGRLPSPAMLVCST